MKGNKVVVTGGKGFIGSALAYKLVQQGADVHVVDNGAGTQERGWHS
ncbi:MAG TPA: NAD-dependent epimerase/dehydratase family protein [Candidatus Paceibacterota bacterium]|jgi:nucleoside-diphosphate-sugar epimerase